MATLADRTHVFIVRIWLEPRELPGVAPEWRGMIEHVASGERHYFRNPAEMQVFVISKAGVQGWQPG